jgi:hypothetical protein
MLHKHHIIPRHAGGTNDPSNIIMLTVEEHANVHKKLYEEYGRWQDEVAYRMLSGQISAQDATIEAIKKTQTGRKHSFEEIEKRRKSRIGKKHSEDTKRKMSENNAMKGKTLSDEQKKILSVTHKGKELSENHKEILRQTHLGKIKPLEQRKKMSESAKLGWEKRRLRKES